MNRFRFPLQALLTVREHKEDMARQRYAETLRACERAAARIEAASTELTTAWATLTNQLVAGVTGDELLRARAWCNVLELKVKERAADLETARHAVDAVWKELMTATRDREQMDRLEARGCQAHRRKAQGEAQKALDELAVHLVQSALPLRLSAPA